MNRLAWTTALSAVLLCGCPVPEIPGRTDDADNGDTAPANSYAGKWKKKNGAVFEVSDDGSKVTGKLLKGTWLFKDDKSEVFASFTFSLERKGDGVAGKARFAFADAPGDSFDSAWECQVAGNVIKAKVEALEFDDDGNVSKRYPEDKEFAFEPAKAAGGPAAAATFKMDVTKMLKAPGKLPVAPDAEVKVGWMARRELTNAGRTMVEKVAIVGEAGDSWQVEYVPAALLGYASMDPGVKDMLMGLVVKKSDWTVTRAVLGKKGTQGKPVGISPVGKGGKAKDDSEEVEVKLKMGGTYDAKLTKYTVAGFGTTKTWTGLDGLFEGVVLKVDAPKGGKELMAKPNLTEVELGGTSVQVKQCNYDNGDAMWTSDHEIVKAFFFGLVKSTTRATKASISVTHVATDAKPELKW